MIQRTDVKKTWKWRNVLLTFYKDLRYLDLFHLPFHCVIQILYSGSAGPWFSIPFWCQFLAGLADVPFCARFSGAGPQLHMAWSMCLCFHAISKGFFLICTDTPAQASLLAQPVCFSPCHVFPTPARDFSQALLQPSEAHNGLLLHFLSNQPNVYFI